jgi:hypothetical protein
MQLLRTGCVVLACLAGVSLEANALTIDFGTVKDANVQSDSSGPLGGGSAILDPFTNSSYSIDSYIGFDIADFQSLGNPAVDVSLDLYGFAARTSLVLNIYGLNDLVSPGWSESTIDWTNAPGIQSDSIDPATTTLLFSGSVSYTANNVISFSDSSFADFINSDTDGLVTFILTQPTATSENHAFSSKESSGNPAIGLPGDFAPTLHITAAPVPAAVWLFGSGLLGLIVVARRRHRASVHRL